MENQPKLFEIEPIRIPRPTLKTINGSEVYRKIAEEIINWDQSEKSELEEIAESIEKYITLRDLSNDNGYELCRTLETDLCYSPDDELVEIMGGAFQYVHSVLQKAVEKWVVDCWIKPKFNIGDKIEVSYKGKMHEGEIVKIKESEANYLVYIPGISSDRTCGIYEKFEDVEPDFFKKNDK